MKDREFSIKIQPKKLVYQLVIIGIGIIPGFILMSSYLERNANAYPGDNSIIEDSTFLKVQNMRDLNESYHRVALDILNNSELTPTVKRKQISQATEQMIETYLKIGHSLVQKSFTAQPHWIQEKSIMDRIWQRQAFFLNQVNTSLDENSNAKVKSLNKHLYWLIQTANQTEDNWIKVKSYTWFGRAVYEEHSEKYFQHYMNHGEHQLSSDQKKYLMEKLKNFQLVHEEFQTWVISEKRKWIKWLKDSRNQQRKPTIIKQIKEDIQQIPYRSEFLNLLRLDILCVISGAQSRKQYIDFDLYKLISRKLHIEDHAEFKRSYMYPMSEFLGCYLETYDDVYTCFEKSILRRGAMNYYSIVKSELQSLVYDNCDSHLANL